ncbi:MAG TPA: flavin reductase family protein [Candidatus Limnocylindrales bacterium]|nr:flavin reductase family protein [Candidatus Limnocylindrales bacterium]
MATPGTDRSDGPDSDDRTIGIDAEAFRDVMGRFATGISVITTIDGDGVPAGITVSAMSSVSLDPPLIMVALARKRFITPIVAASGRYAVNILRHDQQALSDCFAHAPVSPGREEFCGASWRPGATGLPLIDGTLGALECRVVQTYSVGDHELFIAEVDALRVAGGDLDPLLYFRRQYLRVDHGTPSPVEGKDES